METTNTIATRANGRSWLFYAVPILVIAAVPTLAISFWGVEGALDHLIEYLPILMFLSLAVMLFSGFPVAFVLGGLALTFGFIGWGLGVFSFIEFFNFVPRIWGQAAENLVLVAIPTFVFMGVMMEKSGVAEKLLYATQVLLRRVPGALALAVTVMGTILAAMTGIIGASVTMMTALALPSMLRQKYDHGLATGVICAAGTLGILIPPSIMLILMADLLSVSVGDLFMAALGPGLLLAFFYMLYVVLLAIFSPKTAPPLPPGLLEVPGKAKWGLLFKSFLPPAILLGGIKASILLGWATPSEAGAVGAFGVVVLAFFNKRLNWPILKSVNFSSALTVSLVFFIVIAATCFAYVFRSLGGDDVVDHLILSAGLGSWGLMILLMVIVFLLGFFLDWIEITLIILPIFAPMIANFDFGDHVAKADITYWFVTCLAVNLQTSFLTPPFGFALFYMKGCAPEEVSIKSIYRGIIPFVGLQLLCLVCVILFPQLALYLPRSWLG